MMKPLKRLVAFALLCGLIGLTGAVHGQSEIGQIMRDRSIDWQNPQDRAQAVQQIKRIEVRNLEKAREVARQRGKPLRVDLPGLGVRELVGIDEDTGELLYYQTRNVNAAISTGANEIQVAPYSLDGAGLLVGVWDAGSVLSTHQEFNEGASSRINIRDGAASD